MEANKINADKIDKVNAINNPANTPGKISGKITFLKA